MKRNCIILLFLAITGTSWAADYTIRDIEMIVDGRSKIFTILDIVPDLVEGRIFESEAALLDFIIEQKKILDGVRTLSLSYIMHTLEVLDDGNYAVDVTVYTYDTWNIIVLPYAKYDDNTGITLSVRMRDYNVFGQQGKIDVDFDYDYTDSGNHGFTSLFKIDSPLRILDQDFSILFSEKLSYYLNQGITSDTSVGMQYNLPLARQFMHFGYIQQIFFSERSNEYDDLKYGRSYPYIGATIDFGVNIPSLGDIIYEPKIALSQSYTFDEQLSAEESGTRLEWHNILTLGSYTWVDNFRDGIEINFENYQWYKPNVDSSGVAWDVENTAKVTGFFPLSSIISLSNRFVMRYAPNTGISDPGQYQRGVLNVGYFKDTANLGIFLNTDLTILLFKVNKAVEAHMVFFFDLGMAYDHSQSFDPDQDIQYAVGIEGILFPLIARSFYMRLSFGMNIGAMIQDKDTSDWQRFWSNRELFFGIGHHF